MSALVSPLPPALEVQEAEAVEVMLVDLPPVGMEVLHVPSPSAPLLLLFLLSKGPKVEEIYWVATRLEMKALHADLGLQQLMHTVTAVESGSHRCPVLL